MQNQGKSKSDSAAASQINPTAQTQMLIDMEAILAILKSEFEIEQLKIIKILDPFIVQESRYQRQIEPLQGEQQLIQNIIKACKVTNSAIIDLESLEAQYQALCHHLRGIFIDGRKEYFKSRGQYYDKEAEKYILLDKQGLQAVMDHFIEELDADLNNHCKRFIKAMQMIKSLENLIEYEQQLNSDINTMSNTYGAIVDVKTPYMSKYLDNEITFVAKKQAVLYQNFLKMIKAKATADDCQTFITVYGFDVNFQDEKGFCVLHQISNPKIIGILLQYGAKTELTLNYTEPHDHRGFTPLHWHVLEGNIEVVQLLLEAGANPDARSKMETTPLFIATKILPKILNNKGVEEAKATKLIERFIKLLMQHGANVRARNVSTQGGDRHFAMGCPHGHKWDRFEETAYFTEELFGEQASRGMQAWHITQRQELQIPLITEKQDKMQEAIDDLKRENELLKKKLDILMKQLKLEQPEEIPIKKSLANEVQQNILSVKTTLPQSFFSTKPYELVSTHLKQQKIQSLLAMFGEDDTAEKFLAEDIIINKAEIAFSACNSNNYYTADFINLLLHPFKQNSTNSIKAYPAVQAEQLMDLLEKIQNQTETFAFIPLNVAYDEQNPKHTNHWAALIIDKKQQLIMYLDPAMKTEVHEQIIALQRKLNYNKPILENPINFQETEQEQGWIRHCGVYVVELFKAFNECIQQGKSITVDANFSSIPNSLGVKTAFSTIPCGAAENVDKIREQHIEQAQDILMKNTPDNAHNHKSGSQH